MRTFYGTHSGAFSNHQKTWTFRYRMGIIMPLLCKVSHCNILYDSELCGYDVALSWCLYVYVRQPTGKYFTDANALLYLRAPMFSPMNQLNTHNFPCMGKVLCVRFYGVYLKFHTQNLTLTQILKIKLFIRRLNFISVFETRPLGLESSLWSILSRRILGTDLL